MKRNRDRRGTIFPDEAYATPIQQKKLGDVDGEWKKSDYYIREKVEVGILAEDHSE